jgi:hypothetical protein
MGFMCRALAHVGSVHKYILVCHGAGQLKVAIGDVPPGVSITDQAVLD